MLIWPRDTASDATDTQDGKVVPCDKAKRRSSAMASSWEDASDSLRIRKSVLADDGCALKSIGRRYRVRWVTPIAGGHVSKYGINGSSIFSSFSLSVEQRIAESLLQDNNLTITEHRTLAASIESRSDRSLSRRSGETMDLGTCSIMMLSKARLDLV